jgi:uncharacterized protein (TIGR04255 family)
MEVALSLQFDPLERLQIRELGMLADAWRDRFPHFEQHPTLEPQYERFGASPRDGRGVRIELVQQLPQPRCWLLNDARTELVQIQNDRFIRNWRRSDDSQIYPRYEYVCEEFHKDIDRFQAFLAANKLGEIEVNQVEITYINHIVRDGVWSSFGDLAEVLTLFECRYEEEFLPDIEEAGMRVRYVIPDDDGKPIGRLHIQADPGRRSSDNEPVFVLRLTARGRPEGDGIPGALAFMQRGHDWIVNGFAAITTKKMQTGPWGRRDAS